MVIQLVLVHGFHKNQQWILHAMTSLPRGVTLEPGSTRSIETYLGFKFPKKYMARIYPCSGHSLESIFWVEALLIQIIEEMCA